MGHQLQTCPSEPTTEISKRCSRIQVKCPGKSCQSCAGRVIADCVAVSCCPCAVVSIFTLAFLKLPWMMGRKLCLGNKNKKKKLMKHEDKDGNSRSEHGEIGAMESGSCKYSARFEAERVWLELYKVDHLGFGRVSFNGIQSLGL